MIGKLLMWSPTIWIGIGDNYSVSYPLLPFCISRMFALLTLLQVRMGSPGRVPKKDYFCRRYIFVMMQPTWDNKAMIWKQLWTINCQQQGVFFSLPLTDWLSSNIGNALRYSNANFAWNSLFGIVCWLAWKQRNDFVFNDVQEAWDIAVTSITWARHAAGPSRERRRRTTAPMPQTVRWCAPPLNWVKLNTDGAWDPTTGIGKAGGVLRSSEGSWLAGYNRLVGFSSIRQAELWAILDGLSTAWNLNFWHLVLECDNAGIVKDFQRC
ncbi:hypothetical protein K2173_023056 [Erythroxylum novogranatense]|uniref:RNase H type-1 domain-containing protein n=1 Tax=Erythroxylum novogranatense TaxID=1862640 RepID=A0AAV8T814_9ROSI|nr:hypothetical protein K2173_023056 [Erythroxylum novogranatense]